MDEPKERRFEKEKDVLRHRDPCAKRPAYSYDLRP